MKKTFRYEGNTFIIDLQSSDSGYRISLADEDAGQLLCSVQGLRFLEDHRFELQTKEGLVFGTYYFADPDFYLHVNGKNLHFQSVQADAVLSDSDLEYRSPMPGKLIRLAVEVGVTVQEGQTLFVVEAMKMENQVKARREGTVASVNFQEGDVINSEDVLVTLKE